MTRAHTHSALVLVGLLLVSGIAPALTMAETDQKPDVVTDKLKIDVDANGDARVVLVTTYSLTNESEQAAFRGLENDTATQDELKQSFYTRLQQVANETEAQTGRDMQVTSPSISLETRGDTGVVRLSVTWENLLAQDGDSVVLAEPFNSGFAFDRPLVVTAPDGYQIASAQPTPDAEQDTSARWQSVNADDNFSVTFSPTTTETTGNTGPDGEDGEDDGLPLTLIGGAVVVLVASVVLFARR